jgi:hypothetical protein
MSFLKRTLKPPHLANVILLSCKMILQKREVGVSCALFQSLPFRLIPFRIGLSCFKSLFLTIKDQ